MGELAYDSSLISHFYLFSLLVLNDDGEFSISGAHQTAVVDVGRPNQGHSVVDDHHFAVHVNDLSDGRIVEDAMGAQAEKVKVVANVGDAPQSSVHLLDVLEVQVDLHSKNGCILVRRMALEARQGGQNDDHSESFL